MRRFGRVAVVLALFAAGPSARAGDICDYYQRSAPDLYRLLCSGKERRASVAGAYSTFSDGFNLNPGSLPADPTSYGIEAIGSYLRDDTGTWSPNFALVKGFHRIGTGISTSGNNTFYGNDLARRLRGTPNLRDFHPLETPQGHISNLNLGTAFKVYQNGRAWQAKLGLTLRYNKITDTVGGGGGLLVSNPWLTFGVGFTREKISNTLDYLYFGTFSFAARVWILEGEYQVLTHSANLDLGPIQIFTVSTRLGRFLLAGAVRWLDYRLERDVVHQYHASAQFLLSRSLSVGMIYNFIPGTNSLALQYFL